MSSDGRRRRLPNAQMRPDNTGIKSGYLQNNFRIDKNAHDGFADEALGLLRDVKDQSVREILLKQIRALI